MARFSLNFYAPIFIFYIGLVSSQPIFSCNLVIAYIGLVDIDCFLDYVGKFEGKCKEENRMEK